MKCTSDADARYVVSRIPPRVWQLYLDARISALRCRDKGNVLSDGGEAGTQPNDRAIFAVYANQ
jgi:hypothetical protein